MGDYQQCEACESSPAVWKFVVTIAGGDQIKGDVCSDCADDMASYADVLSLIGDV